MATRLNRTPKETQALKAALNKTSSANGATRGKTASLVLSKSAQRKLARQPSPN
jgi:hypothetical protein